MSDATVSAENECQAAIITDAKAPFDNPDAELIIRSSDNVDFRVFKSFLSVTSSVFKDMFAFPQGPAGVTGQEMRDGLAVIQITEGSRIVETLLRFCFPNILTPVPDLKTMDEMLPMLEVSIKYGIGILEKRVREALFSPPVVKMGAMKLFVIAYQHGWETEMRIAAEYTLCEPAWERLYVVELESITGGDLHRLQLYRLNCTTAAIQVATTFEWYPAGSPRWWQCSSCEDATNEILFGTVYGGLQRAKPVGWWVRYMKAAAKELAKRPFGNTVLDAKMVDRALQEADNCPNCSQKKNLDVRFTEFCNVFAAEVDRVVSKVSSISIKSLDRRRLVESGTGA
jgi:hypothetical protein